MQPKNNVSNIVLFVLLSALVLAGSYLLQMWLYPPPPIVPTEAKVNADLMAREAGDALSLASGIPTLGGAAKLASDAVVAQYAGEHHYRLPLTPRPVEKKEPKAPPTQPAPKPKPAVPAVHVKHEEIRIGGDRFKMQMTLTSLGGGVASVVLTHFKAADKMGRPEDTNLELVPGELNKHDPSNVLFHYEKVDDDRPVNTLGRCQWKLESSKNKPEEDVHEVIFSTDVPGEDLRIIKTYTLRPTDYHVGLKVEIQRKTGGTEPIKFRYQLTSGHGLPIEGWWYTNVYRNGLVGLAGEGRNFERTLEDSGTIGIKSGGNDIHKTGDKWIEYAGVAVQYFASLVVVDDEQDHKDFLERARPTVEGLPNPLNKPYLDDISMRVMTQPLSIKDPVVHKYLLYYGPVKVKLLGDSDAKEQGVPPEVLDRYINKLHLNTLTDYGKFGWWTDLLVFFTNIMHNLLGWLHSYLFLPYGFGIIALTLLVRGIMHPISRKQAKTSMKMQQIAPEVKKLQEKYKNDRAELARAQMELYRRHGVSPMGSCWIVFAQMPIFLGLYYSLQESIHFRLAPFIWIKNLAAPDMLVWWGENIPWLSRPADQGSFLYLGPYFNILPVIAVVLMLIQQKYLTPPPTDEAQAMNLKMMKYMMIFMGLMFYKVAAGLCIYFIVSSAWGVAERKLLPKAKPLGEAAAPAGTGRPTQTGGPGKKGPISKGKGSRNGQTNGAFSKVREMWAEILKQAKKK